MKKHTSNKLTRKEWWILGGLTGLCIFYYVLIRWVLLAHFCSEETIKMFTKVHYARSSILSLIVAFLTLVTFFGLALLRDYWNMRKGKKE